MSQMAFDFGMLMEVRVCNCCEDCYKECQSET